MSTDRGVEFHVFISHSSQDRSWADAACDVLEQRSIRCWIAPRNITPGSEWGAAIIDGIDQSRAMVVIFSANANESAQVRREVERAIGKSIPILPLRIEDIRPQGAMEFALSNTHWLDAFAPPVEDRLTQLADSVEALLGAKQVKRRDTAAARFAPLLRKSRSKWLVGSIIGMLALVALLVVVFRGGGGVPVSGSTPPTPVNPRKEVDADTASDETLNFQGRWLAVAESTPKSGAMPDSQVTQRRFTITIQEHSFSHRRHATLTEMETLNGSITFKKDGEKQTFSVLGTDGHGTRKMWAGVYEFKDDVLQLCYREAEGMGNQRLPPLSIFVNGERDTHFVKLARPGPGPGSGPRRRRAK